MWVEICIIEPEIAGVWVSSVQNTVDLVDKRILVVCNDKGMGVPICSDTVSGIFEQCLKMMIYSIVVRATSMLHLPYVFQSKFVIDIPFGSLMIHMVFFFTNLILTDRNGFSKNEQAETNQSYTKHTTHDGSEQ